MKIQSSRDTDMLCTTTTTAATQTYGFAKNFSSFVSSEGDDVDDYDYRIMYVCI